MEVNSGDLNLLLSGYSNLGIYLFLRACIHFSMVTINQLELGEFFGARLLAESLSSIHPIYDQYGHGGDLRVKSTS
jgi:hypothetical protein